MSDDLTIKKDALLILGNNYDNLDVSDKEKIDRQWESVIIKALSRYRWGFAVRRGKLSGQLITEGEKYEYSYALPEDFITLVNLYGDVYENYVIKDYDLSDRAYANGDNVHMKYIKKIGPDEFTGIFREYVKYELAWVLCFDLTGDRDRENSLYAQKEDIYKIATGVDAGQRPPFTIHSGALIDVR
jgi:hypothetical protein